MASLKVIVIGEQADVMGSWWDDCEAADKSKKYLFEVVEYEEKHSFSVGSGQGTKTMLATGSYDNCQICVPILQAICCRNIQTSDDVCDNDDLEANED